jgi:two-component system, OmpR family, sensor kinase
MDGFKRKLNHSIQFRLSLWISIIIFLMALISVIISYFSALNEAEEIQDDSFKQIAQLIQKNHNTLLLNDGVNNVSKIIIQSINSKPIQGIKHLNLPNNLPDGFHTLIIDGFKYRILKVTLANQQVIAIAQKTILPDEAALSGAISTALPMLLLLPILIIVAYLLIRHAFVPMLKLSEDIQKRSAHDLTHLQQANMPIEVLPFISSINLLFDKVNKSVELQNRFIADAAHELRSPLTALSLQSERLANAEMSLTAAEHLSKLRQGISRAAKLVEQLLSFAKAQRLTNIKDTNLSVNQTILNVLEDLIPIAENKSLNISIKSNLDVTINMNEVDLMCIIKNLIDNAIRYTPNGGEINLSLSKDSKYVVFEVEDSGHGIPESEKERVFDSFYRILGNNTQGSGLGLSIVKTIINRVEGRVQLLDSDSFLSGLKIKVFLPIKNI